MIFNYTCRSSYHVFARNYAFSVPFHSTNEFGSLAFGRIINRVSRHRGNAWSDVFGGCESAVWRDFSFHQNEMVSWG